MSNNHFVVAARDNAWHFSFKGAMTGPFTSREDAVEAAIAQAGEEDHDDLEVIVLNADMTPETVWRQAVKS